MHPISLNRASVFRFLLVVFICRCASATLSKRIGSAVDAHQQRDRCASANNFTVQKQGKGCVGMTNRTVQAGFLIYMIWRTLADVDYCTRCPPLKRIISTYYPPLAEGGKQKGETAVSSSIQEIFRFIRKTVTDAKPSIQTTNCEGENSGQQKFSHSTIQID